VSAVKIAAFRVAFEGVKHGLRRKKGIGGGIRYGGINTAKFTKVLQVLNRISCFLRHFFFKIIKLKSNILLYE
jgi:hypothetical protein